MCVQFTDASTNVPGSWAWNFGDGTPNNTEQNPVHTFSSVGTYSVTLIATNPGGSSGITKTEFVTVIPQPPIVEFAANTTEGCWPLCVQFADTSPGTPAYGPTAWQWNFGDGTPNSTEQNPVHCYMTTGVYAVTLTATNDGGSGGITKSSYITVLPQQAVAELHGQRHQRLRAAVRPVQ